MAVEAILLLIVGVVIGAALGWFAGSRPAADLRQRLGASEEEARSLDGRFKQAITDLAAASERAQRADDLMQELDSVRARAEALNAELATMKANAVHLEEQKAALLTAQESLRKEFEAAGAKVLAQAQETFLNRAQERFAHSEEKQAERLKALLAPVDARLKSYEEQVQELEKSRVDAFGQLAGLIQSVRDGQEAVKGCRSSPRADCAPP